MELHSDVDLPHQLESIFLNPQTGISRFPIATLWTGYGKPFELNKNGFKTH